MTVLRTDDMRLLFLVLLLFLGANESSMASQILPSDLVVTMTANPDSGLVPHQMFELTIAVTNRGPENIHTLGLYSSYFSDEFALSLASNDCGLSFAVLDGDDWWAYAYLWSPNRNSDLAVGQTKTCHLKLALSLEAPPTVAFTFTLPSDYVDPDPSNDHATVYLHRDVSPVPADSWFARCALMAVLSGLACSRLRRSNRCRSEQ
jgi:hypothetical protein